MTLLFVGSFAAAATAWGQSAVPPSGSSVLPRARAPGYLGADAVPDHRVFLPPPPAVDSPAGIADIAIFHATRSLESGPRWQLAASDDRIGSRKMLGDFGCAMGVDLTVVEAPALARTLARANADLLPMVGDAKDHYRRPRPFVTESGPTCVDVSPEFAASGSYPSGHSAAAWLYALLLSEIDPGNAAAIVARGRAFGESRVVCGVHYVERCRGRPAYDDCARRRVARQRRVRGGYRCRACRAREGARGSSEAGSGELPGARNVGHAVVNLRQLKCPTNLNPSTAA